jgi:hypothetical protein
MNTLFAGLKDDNQKLAEDVRFAQQENSHLREFIETQKQTMAQQSSII